MKWCTKLNRNIVNRYIRLIRERIVEICNEAFPFKGVMEIRPPSSLLLYDENGEFIFSAPRK